MAEENSVARKTLEDRNRASDLERVRHSCAHVMAAAVMRIWPNAQLDIGPSTNEGFYYDFDLPDHRFTPEDFPRIEEEMKKIIKENQVFQKEVRTREEVKALLEAKGQKFKLERLNDIPEGEPISTFTNGEFMDLCAGPHVMRTGNIKAFKLLRVAAAYYRGKETNPQLQRLYGTAFMKKTELEEWLQMMEEAKRRDHRKIGKEMRLFAFDEDVGPGMPLWLPKGGILIAEIEKLAMETEFAAGYERVKTPHLARENMYKTSGHLPYYADSMFPPIEMKETMADGTEKVERYYLKAMNCPHHHKIFASYPRSYRELPLRLAEYGCCYRYEQSGELFGLMRVRSLQMNDAHIYCTPEQFADEFRAVNDMYLKYFKIFGIEKFQMRFSTHDPERLGQKYVNEPELWKKTEDMVRDVLIKSGINYVEIPNEAAFYGPKIDVQVWSAIGREFTLATNQVDFAVPGRFGLVYRTRDNTEATPLCIHRAPLGTHERFIGFLIEHYAGNFPLWLAPEQVRILPIGSEQMEFCEALRKRMHDDGIRVTLDCSGDKIGGKIRNAETDKVHTMFVVGHKEQEANSVALRVHGKGDQGVKPVEEVLADLKQKIAARAAD
ncbi:MAG: threonine--tRNA ligase [Verrucomicrobia bacterium]|nr:threonine--tRNA ligase [Verrucomicrobiota bacterium]MBR6463840.1 threonine--tRNA ligase [Verrucomicrobiota bacterium]